jgi:uncharacterized damage-inducible protein DinB
MKKLVLFLSLLLTTVAFAQTAPAAAPKSEPKPALTVAQILDRQLSNLEREVVPAAEAMPDDKFDFAPGDKIKDGEFKGVKTFAIQVRHIAATNQLIAACLLGTPSPLSDEESDLGPAAMKSKAEIVAYLKDSFTKMHQAIALSTESNLTEMVRNPFGEGKSSRLGITIIVLAHTNDHYGQMVEYLRMNGIIPPASRPAPK